MILLKDLAESQIFFCDGPKWLRGGNGKAGSVSVSAPFLVFNYRYNDMHPIKSIIKARRAGPRVSVIERKQRRIEK